MAKLSAEVNGEPPGKIRRRAKYPRREFRLMPLNWRPFGGWLP